MSRLSCIPAALAARFEPSTLALAQVWTCCSSWTSITKAQAGALVMRTQPMGAHLSDPQLAPFRALSCQVGIQRSALGMLGKVWGSGSLYVVQNLSIIPTSVHPRNKLPDVLLERIAESAYIPIFDLRNPSLGVVACLEVMMSSSATQELIANVISHTCDLLSQFQLSLRKPSDHPSVPSALPSPFQSMLLASGAGSPRLPGYTCGSSPASASAMAATALSSPRQTPQQQCYAALLEREVQWQRQQGGFGTSPPTQKHSSINSYTMGPHSFPMHQVAHRATGSRSSTCSSQSGYAMGGGSGASSPRSPAFGRISMSMSRTASVRRLDSLSDMLS